DPVVQDALRKGRPGGLHVTRDELVHEFDVDRLIERLEIDHTQVAATPEVAGAVEHVGDPARHPGRKVPAGVAEHDHPAPRHGLATVVAHALHYGQDTAVADAEALAGHAAHVGLAAGGAVEGHVADDDVVLGGEAGGAGREHGQLAAREAFAPVVVGVAFQRERDSPRYEGTEALARRPGEVDADGVVGQPLAAPARGHVVP